MEPLRARTLPELVRAGAEHHGDREAIVDGPVRLTYAGLAEEVARFAGALAARGVGKGDRVALWAPNSWRWIVAALGVVTAGGVLVPLNTRFKGPEAGYVLQRSGARLLLVDDGFLGNRYVDSLASEDLPDLSDIVPLAEWDAFVSRTADVTATVDPDDLSDLFFTSGTTGRPKGAMLTHRQSTQVYVAWSELAGLRAGDRYLLVNPCFNTFGYKAGVIACLLRGATIVPQPVFDVAASLRLIEQERITVLPGPPTLYTSMLDHPDRHRHDLSSLRVAVTGATTVPVVMIERLRDELRLATVLTAYGLTESCGTATMCRPDDDPVTVSTTCGAAIDGVEVTVDPDSREVLVRGYNVMRGYWQDPAATADAIDADGWLHTGDVGALDERGYLRITDRLKDMVIVGGFNVYPAEIEQVLARHDGVAEVAVIGVPDARLGEVTRAYVVPRPDRAPTQEELTVYCRDRLANFKVPRSYVFLDALPRNASGKVLKTTLRGQA
ncbi:FadD3 family acyl-CoA ligase [Dactylosporangium aurantiacum]|uniref:FadD3 family acyl-CoA ligase n=1 Tax=Dactylosporangium aurantiacum TaxID=35754 RepID=A0A9Q9IBV0_9ACTN|nr:FadD3 family acyl-CoA ligase [Dactylosporangium aurantiacum]MDG6106374.1 FadD3 family acyl-CoA ligase [Dactylosporangium aurantiacum]UWZ50584.1 FadD3 family acyl-CoA ligase [Dactylosporangium aurantiacum]